MRTLFMRAPYPSLVAITGITLSIQFASIAAAQETSQKSVQDAQEETQLPAAGVTPFGYAAANKILSDTEGTHPVIRGHTVFRGDSILAVADSLTRGWVRRLNQTPVTGIYQFPMAELYADVGADAKAAQLLDAWLATPTLTVGERVYTLSHAIPMLLAMNPAPSPGRIDLAKRYLARLDTLPEEQAAMGRLQGRFALMKAYMRRQEIVSAVEWGMEAYRVAGTWADYRLRSDAAVSKDLGTLAMLLAGQSRGMERLDSLLTVLHGYIGPPPALLAHDTATQRIARIRAKQWAELEAGIKRLGRPNTVVTAMYWFNMTAPTTPSSAAQTAQALPLNDGIIRIVGMGWFNCPFCRRSWKNIQKVYKHLPAGVQILYVDWTEGVWGGDQVSPEEEAAHIRHYVLERKKYTFPFAIWAGPRDSTSDGGSQPRVMPLWREFDLNAGPSWLVVDGHGVVRGIFYGDNGIDEFNAMRVVRYLITERAHAENHS